MSSTGVAGSAASTAGRSKWAAFYRGVLFQMILFGALSFVGPAMGDALSNLGGGGLSKPWLANVANCLSYAMSFLVTLFGGPLINKIGIKWSCFIAATAMPLHGSAFYVSARYQVDWYLLLGNLISGLTSGFLYVGESTAMLSYPHPEQRGLYLGIWSAMRSSGSLLGGAINFSNNHQTAVAGGVAWSTYIIFVSFACTGVIWALLLSPTQKELVILWRSLHEKKILAVFLPSFYSFFYGATMGTYLSLHFSVRARALSSLLVPAFTIVSVLAYGKLLDGQWSSLRRRASICSLLWIVPTAGAFIWVGIEYHRLGEKAALDYTQDTASWFRAYIPYLVIFVAGYWTQLSLYWILGNFSFEVGSTARTGGLFRAFETAGQAVAYGLSSSATLGGAVPFYVNCALFVLVLPCIWWLIHLMPEADVAEGIEASATPGADLEQGKAAGDVDVKKL